MAPRNIAASRHASAALGLCVAFGASACVVGVDQGPSGPAASDGFGVDAGLVSPAPRGSGAGPTEVGGVGDPTSPDGVGDSTRFPKLSNAQWERSVQDLLRLDAPSGLSDMFTQEPRDKGYDTAAAATLTISGDAWVRYQAAAEALAEQVARDPAKLAKIAPTGTFTDDSARGAAFVAQFGLRAYRRPLTQDEQAAYVALFAQGPALVDGSAFNAGVQLVVSAMLQSPHFLYRVESAHEGEDGRAYLSSFEVATRLSYALTGSTPSDALLDAAAKDQLSSVEGVAHWADQLLNSPRAREILLSFHDQTFDIESYGTQDKDSTLGFDAAALAPVMKEEARAFLGRLVDTGAGVEALLTSNVAFVNEDTAPFYGLSGVSGQTLSEQHLDAQTRAGLFTQLGFLTKNATRSGSDPVHRGLAVLRKLLCDEPDPPPMMFALPKPMAGLTTREVYERATACGVGCHDTLINPPGFAFEVFDAVGRVRAREADKPIDATGTLLVRDGYSPEEKRAMPTTTLRFDGPVDLMNKLVDLPRVHECYARNWMKFALARELSPVERGASKALGAEEQRSGSMRALLLALVKLDTFRARVSTPQEGNP